MERLTLGCYWIVVWIRNGNVMYNMLKGLENIMSNMLKIYRESENLMEGLLVFSTNVL